MFRVPVDPQSPTFNQTFKVGFLRWLTSNAPERKEWMRRRTAAAWVAQHNQQQQINQTINRAIGRS